MDAVTLIAYFIAIAIPAFTVYLFIALDIFGTGKFSTILMCLGWGAVGAYLLALMINNTLLGQGVAYDTVVGLTAPPTEEILKALFLIYLITRPRFRYIVDGAVYGIAVGIGFALSENLFIYLPREDSAVLGTAITRVLSTSLMHATASGLVGIALGRMRRARSSQRALYLLLGLGPAIAVHIAYNNMALVSELPGPVLLLAAIGFGIGGSIVIAWQIGQGLSDEKKRFAETLGGNVGVSTGERKAVQQLGGSAIEQIFGDLGHIVGNENVAQVRRLLVIQANIGILQNNLTGPASERLRKAWEEEIAQLRAEFEQIRKKLGGAVNLFIQSVFPSDDTAMQDAFNREMAKFDPTLLHTFDMFMRVSELAEVFTPDQLAEMAERLNRIGIFANVSLANLENLSRAISIQAFEDGQLLFDQGDQGNAMYLIDQGEVGIYARDQAGQFKLLRTYKAGDVVGEFALLDGGARSARGQAQGPISVLVLERQVFMRFIQSRPQVVLAMLQYLADKARYTTQSVETSVAWMTQIAQGSYQAPQALATQPSAPAVATEPVAIALEPEALSEDTPALVNEVFSKAAASLHEREQAIRAGAAPQSP